MRILNKKLLFNILLILQMSDKKKPILIPFYGNQINNYTNLYKFFKSFRVFHFNVLGKYFKNCLHTLLHDTKVYHCRVK